MRVQVVAGLLFPRGLRRRLGRCQLFTVKYNDTTKFCNVDKGVMIVLVDTHKY